MTKYAIIINCNNPCTFEIKHIASSFDFDRLRKHSVIFRLKTFTTMHYVFVLYRSVIFKLEDCIYFECIVHVFLNLCSTLHCESQLVFKSLFSMTKSTSSMKSRAIPRTFDISVIHLHPLSFSTTQGR